MTNIKKIATEYAGLVKQENEIKTKKKSLGLKVKEAMEEIGAKQFGIDKGIFTIHRLPSYKFSTKFQKKVKELEVLKELEISKGIAKATYSEFIWFKTNK